MTDELISFIDAMDRCWLERRYRDLSDYLAPDVVFVAPGGRHRIEGIAAAAESYCGFMETSRVHAFAPSNHIVTRRAGAAVVEYDWRIRWTRDGESFDASGREVLALAHQENGWRVIWRMQLSA